MGEVTFVFGFFLLCGQGNWTQPGFFFRNRKWVDGFFSLFHEVSVALSHFFCHEVEFLNNVIFRIFYSLAPMLFGKRVSTNVLWSFHMAWIILIFILENIPAHLRDDLEDPIFLYYFSCTLIIEVSTLPFMKFLQPTKSWSLSSKFVLSPALFDSMRFCTFPII